MRFLFFFLAIAITAHAQNLKYSIQLTPFPGATNGDVRQDAVTYDGKGGCAFVVEYNNQAMERIGYRLFWINATRQLATKDFGATEILDVLRATPKGFFLDLSEGSLAKAVRDKAGTITLQPFGVNGERMELHGAYDPLGFFTIGHGTPFIPVTLNRYSN